MFKVWLRFGIFIANFEHISHLCSDVSIVNFEHVIAGWVVYRLVHAKYIHGLTTQEIFTCSKRTIKRLKNGVKHA